MSTAGNFLGQRFHTTENFDRQALITNKPKNFSTLNISFYTVQLLYVRMC